MGSEKLQQMWQQAQASPTYGALVREPFGRTMEGLGGVVDMANLVGGALLPDPSGRNRPVGPTANPVGGSEWARQQFGLPPVMDLPTAPQRIAATGYQVLGPMVAGAGLVKGVQGAQALGERGSVGSPPPGKPPPGLGGVASAEEIGPLWRDNILDALGEWPQEKGTTGQLRAHLAKYRGTSDQAKWIGLDDFLEKKPNVTKEEIGKFVEEHPLKVEERVLGEPRWTQEHSATLDALEERNQRGDTLTRWEEQERQRLITLENEHSAPGGTPAITKFSQYQTPGGENYRELLLKLPPGQAEQHAQAIRRDLDELTSMPARETTFRGEDRTAAFDRLRDEERQLTYSPPFKSSHFDDPNILAHIRFNERRDVSGTSTLHLEEIQSDWHQQGRAKGYQDKNWKPASAEAYRKLEADYDQAVRNFERAEGDAVERYGIQVLDDPEHPAFRVAQAEVDRAHEALVNTKTQHGIPDAPFKKDWPLLAMKRAIRWAAENGQDQITWTTGAQQAERYDLSKQVEKITFNKTGHGGPEGTIYVAAHPLQGGQVISKYLKPEEVADFVGKELAEKITGKDDYGSFSGEGLKVGGEGMRAFYDRELPNVMNKFVKKWGAKVGTTKIPTTTHQYDDPMNVGRPTSSASKDETVWSLRLTPTLKKAALRGMELSRADRDEGGLVG